MPRSATVTLSRWEQAREDRRPFDTLWQDTADYVRPTKRFFDDPSNSPITNRAYKRARIYDEIGVRASQSLAAAEHGLLFNPTTVWLRFGLEDFDELDSDDAREWLGELSNAALSHLNNPASGFATASFETALDLTTFGMGPIQLIDARDEFRVRARNLCDFWFCEDSDGRCTDVFHRIRMTVAEAAETFGADNLSEKSRRILESAKSSDARTGGGNEPYKTKIAILHAIGRNMERQHGKVDAANKPWKSEYLEIEAGHLIEGADPSGRPNVGGFDENQYLYPRFYKDAEEVYGESPSTHALAGIKNCNVMKLDILTAGEIAVRPPMWAPAGSIDGRLDTFPGAMVWGKVGSKAENMPQPIFTGSDPRIGVDLLKHEQKGVEEFYFLDALKLPELDRMTAEEIITRRQQGLLRASPMLSRHYDEWLSPLAMRLARWLIRTQRVRPMPRELAGRRVRIHYLGPMALSQQESEAMAFSTSMAQIAPLLELSQEAADNINIDAAVRGIFAMRNVSPRFLNTLAELQKMRRARGQKTGAAEQIALATQAAAATRDVAGAMKDVGIGAGGAQQVAA